MSRKLFFLILIILISIFLRLYKIDTVPPSASLDEASIGWNAYSILKTGKDEYGYKFPLLLRAYDDWRPALYVYTVVPFIKIFDLNVVAVRLPSVILSIITVIGIYFLAKELFKKQNSPILQKFNPEHLALIAMFLIATSPWHIYISRLGHEVNLAFSAFIFGLLFFFKRNIYFSAFFFVISFMSYQTEKVFVPIIIVLLTALYYKDLLKFRRKIIFAFLFSLIILIPFIIITLSPNALIRLSGTNIINFNQSKFIEQSLLLKEASEDKDYLGMLVYNRRFLYPQIFSESYLSHFNPNWLFSNVNNDFHKVPGMGLLYTWELPFIVLGIYLLLRHNFDKKLKILIFIWFFSAPIAASITTDYPHALRSLVFLPTWQIFGAIGILYLSHFKNNIVRKTFFGILTVAVLLTTAYFIKQYFEFFPKKHSDSFQYALYKAIPYINEYKDDYRKIIISNNKELRQSYMFYLFYSKYDPNLYLKGGGTVSGGYEEEHAIENLVFKSIDSEFTKDTLYVGNYLEIPSKYNFLEGSKIVKKEMRPLKILKNLNGEEKIKIAVIKNE